MPTQSTEVIIADGFTDNFSRLIIASSFSHCLEASSLVHELAHIVRGDPYHNNTAFWASIGNLEERLKRERCSVEQLAKEDLARQPPHGQSRFADGKMRRH